MMHNVILRWINYFVLFSILRCISEDLEQFPVEDIFVQKYLKDIPLQKRLKELNDNISHYTKLKLVISETQFKGLGIYLQQNLEKYDLIISYNEKRVINSHMTNFGMFFQNSLLLQMKKLNFKVYKEILKHPLKQKFLIILNFYQHFKNINQSILRADLLGFSDEDKIAPIFKIRLDELEFFDEPEQYEIRKQQRMAKQEYESFCYIFDEILSSSQFNLFFQSDKISFSEYLYFDFILKSRVHKVKKNDIFMIPVYHYSNQQSNVKRLQLNSYHQRERNSLVIRNSYDQVFQKGEEYLINYGYSSAFTYLFHSGFLTDIIDIYCVKLPILPFEEAKVYLLYTNNCINEQTLKGYSMVKILSQLTELKQSRCEKLVEKDYSKMGLPKLEAMFNSCQKMFKNIKFAFFWDNVINELRPLIQQQLEKIQQVQQIKEYKIKNEGDPQVLSLLQQQFNFQLSCMQKTENTIQMFQQQYS